MSTQVQYYTRETAPHRAVDELTRSTHEPSKCAACKTHEEDPAKPECYSAVCAACNWSRHDVAKLRAAKRKAFLSGQKKLPPLRPPVAFPRAFPKGFDPHAVVLPPFKMSNPFLAVEVLQKGVAARYLEAVGVKRTKPNFRTWTCGCMTDHNENTTSTTCKKHEAAFNGNPND